MAAAVALPVVTVVPALAVAASGSVMF